MLPLHFCPLCILQAVMSIMFVCLAHSCALENMSRVHKTAIALFDVGLPMP